MAVVILASPNTCGQPGEGEVCRGLGSLVQFALMPGERGEITGAEKLIEGLSLGALLADKAYDADQFRDLLKSKGIEPVIPARKGRLNQLSGDDKPCSDRHQ